MKKRVFNVLNFLSLNVLFFAIYLNFVHKDVNTLPAVSASTNAAVKSFTTGQAKNTIAVTTQQNKKTNSFEN